MGVGIQVEHLNAWFGKTQALYDISMNVAANHATAIIGPSGCGKSTFVRCLNRMHETIPNATVKGHVTIAGLDIYGKGVSPVTVRRRIGMVFQKPNPFPTMSIYDNVAAGLKLNGFSFELKQQYTIVIVTHNMQQAARVADFTGFFLMGKLIELDKTEKMFTNPTDKRTEDYITGRFG